MTRNFLTVSAILAALTALAAQAAEMPIYHDCRPSEDIVNGRTVHKTICRNENGEWVEPERKKALQPPPIPASSVQKAKPKPVYHDCRPSEDVVNGRTVYKRVCQNGAGAWVELPAQ